MQFSKLKGFTCLKADAVVLCEVKPGHVASSPQHLYVAASRARHLLAVAEHAAPAQPKATLC